MIHTLVGFFAELGQKFQSLWSVFVNALAYLFSINEFRREVTEQYPDPISSKTIDDLPPRTRGLLFNDIDKCTGCGECKKICPTQCIHMELDPGKDEHNHWVKVFNIDISQCVFCGLCTDVCQPKSLEHQKTYELSATSPREMMFEFGRGPVTEEHRRRWASMARGESESWIK